jgi:hypothetical protein
MGGPVGLIALGVLVAFPSQWLGIGLIAAGLAWAFWNRRSNRRRAQRPKKARRIKAPPNRAYLRTWEQHRNRACRRIETEIGAACQEARAFIDQADGFPAWKARNADFIEAALGSIARAKFEGHSDDGPEQTRQRLVDLAESLSPEKVRLIGPELEQAITQRTA